MHTPLAIVLFIAFCLAVACLVLPADAAPPTSRPATYTNPVGGDSLRMGDPFVLHVGKNYYLYGTTARDGFKCWTSADLVHWDAKGYAYQRTDKSWGSGSYWAPEVTAHKGKFYMVYSCNGGKDASGKDIKGFRLCVAVSDKAEGPFKDLYGPWIDLGWSAIDADLFIDDDGTPYLYFAKVGEVPKPEGGKPADADIYGEIYGVKLKADLSAADGEAVLCSKAEQEWEQPDRARRPRSRCNEGPMVFTPGSVAGKEKVYYMTFSAGHWASPRYAIGYNTAAKPLGPWTKSKENPLVSANAAIGVAGPGHNSVTTSPDGKELWMVYHALGDATKPGGGGRTVKIDRLIVAKDGGLKLVGPTRLPTTMPGGAE
jgi:beta-xylosidase